MERELRRHEAALAETAALLVLNKKSPGDLGRRGRYHGPEARTMIVALIEEEIKSGARRARACAVVGVSVRTVERWRGPHPQDARQGPRATPSNALTTTERADVLALVNGPAYRDASPHQIVPRLADAGVYLATGPQQVWSWDITYLKSPVRGVFWYRYLMMDI